MELGERWARVLVGDWQAASNRSFRGDVNEDGSREMGIDAGGRRGEAGGEI